MGGADCTAEVWEGENAAPILTILEAVEVREILMTTTHPSGSTAPMSSRPHAPLLSYAVLKGRARRIEFIDDYAGIGAGQGGWREDHQYYSQEAGI